MTEYLINYIEWGAAAADRWGYLLVLTLMAVESSFIPFPSEVVMIPAGFLAYRRDLFLGSPTGDLIAVIFFGTAGSILGAYVNYFLFLKLGRPFLYRYGKYLFLSPQAIGRAEEIFNRHGEITTFVCRFIPAVRQLISIPAGLAGMPLFRFTLFTALGAGLWCGVLAFTGYYLASLAGGMSYAELVVTGGARIREHLPWLLLGLSALVGAYILLHQKIMTASPKS